MTEKPKTDIVALFENAKKNETFLKVCAPMVRYSRSQFRSLVRKYGVDLCFTPMIIADSFCKSQKARLNDFTTYTSDTPLIMQVAAKTDYDFVGAAELASSYIDGIDLNCGCPQRWAMKDGFGCALLNKPEVIHSIVRSFKNRLPANLSVSVKIRLLKDLKDTVELCRQLEMCGLTFISIHGRKQWQKSSDPVDVSALATIKQSIQIPCIANGGIKNLSNAVELYESTKCDGIMAAQGMLTNPSLFSGSQVTTTECLQDWLNICNSEKEFMTYQCIHHHFVFMLEKVLNKSQKRIFNNLNKFDSIVEYLYDNFEIKIDENSENLSGEKISCHFDDIEYSLLQEGFPKSSNNYEQLQSYDETRSHGKYFTTFVQENNDINYIDNSLFC